MARPTTRRHWTSQDITISGSRQYAAGDLDSSATTVTVSGSGDVTVWARDSLTLDVSGSGSVSYYGRPQITTRSSDSGSVNSLGDK